MADIKVVADVAELAALILHEDTDWARVGISEEFYFDASSFAVHDGEEVIRPGNVLVTQPGRWLLSPAGQASGGWELAYFRLVLDADERDGGEGVDTGVEIESDHEYIFGLQSNTPGLADYSDPSTIKILQILQGSRIILTPTVGGGVDEADGGVPHPLKFDDIGIFRTEEGSAKPVSFLGAGSKVLVPGVGSEVYGEFTYVETAYLAYSMGSASTLFVDADGVVRSFCGDGEVLTGAAMFFFIARRRVA